MKILLTGVYSFFILRQIKQIQKKKKNNYSYTITYAITQQQQQQSTLIVKTHISQINNIRIIICKIQNKPQDLYYIIYL